MKNFHYTRFIFLLLVWACSLYSEPMYQRDSSLSIDEFVEYCATELNGTNDLSIETPTIETSVWGVQNVILGFYRIRYQGVKGILLFPSHEGYMPVQIDSIMEPGIGLDSLTVFFANTDKDTAKELIVLCKTQTNYHGGEDGKMYTASVFDDINPREIPSQLVYLQEISDKLYGGCDCFNNETENYIETSTAKFRDAAGVKAALKKLGY